MKTSLASLSILLLLIISSCSTPETSTTYTIRIADELIDAPIDGRALLLISSNDNAEPRFQISDDPGTQLVYGMDIEGFTSKDKITFVGNEFGYPLEHLSDLPEGDYFVQALFHVYETFNLATGHTVKLPMDGTVKLPMDGTVKVSVKVAMDGKVYQMMVDGLIQMVVVASHYYKKIKRIINISWTN